MVELWHASTFLRCLGDERFRGAVARHADLGPVVGVADVEERSAALGAEVEGRWDEVRDQIEGLLRRWCDALAVEPSHRHEDTTDHLLFVLDRERLTLRADEDVMWAITADGYACTATLAPEEADEVRRIVPPDHWASIHLELAPDDPPGADSTTEASLLIALAIRAAVWRLHRLLVDPVAVPPRGRVASDAVASALGLPTG